MSRELAELRAVIRDVVADSWGRAPLSDVVPDAADHAAALWRQATQDIGLVALHLDEDNGGANLGLAATAAVVAEAARQLAPVPLLTSLGMAPTVLTAGDILVPDLVAPTVWGRVRTTLTPRPVTTITVDGATLHGAAGVVPDLPGAERILLCLDTQDGIDVWAVDADTAGVAITPVEVLDPTRPQARVDLDGADATLVARLSADQWEHARAIASLLVASELIAIASHVLATTADYARTRQQFDRPIGSFQAVKHTLADMHLAVTRADAAVQHAIAIADGADGDLVADACTALALAGEATEFATREAIHVHGGIGFTWEHDLHWYRRRAESAAVLVMSPREARDHFATALGF
jgi:alkylation response protein AidB-like acyl-CoA dehydrogenase